MERLETTTSQPEEAKVMIEAMMDEQRRYGIEIECFLPYGASSQAARTNLVEKMVAAGIDFEVELNRNNHITRSYWKAVSDGSIHPQPNYFALEIVSPPLQGHEGLVQIQKVCKVLEALGAKVNKSCGFHVHHDATDFKSKHFQNMKRIYTNSEAVLDAMMAPSRRGNGNQFCRSLQGIGETWRGSRYYKLNIQAYHRHGTLEFRHHQGTVDAIKVVAWIHITQAMMVRAKAAGGGSHKVVSEIFHFFTSLRLFGYYHEEGNEGLKTVLKEVRAYYRARVEHFAAAAAQAVA